MFSTLGYQAGLDVIGMRGAKGCGLGGVVAVAEPHTSHALGTALRVIRVTNGFKVVKELQS